MAQSSILEDYTVVSAKEQTKGRGQIASSWHSEKGKNLTISIFTSLKNLTLHHRPYLNFAAAIGVFQTLQAHNIPNIAIKWPNDIMAERKKIAGILIESTLTSGRIKNTIIGVGLNVNQTDFPESIANVTSIQLIKKEEQDKDLLLKDLVNNIKVNIDMIEKGKLKEIYELYHKYLFCINIPKTFKSHKNNNYFMGIIKGVSENGNLQVQLDDDSVQEFEIKEISFAKA